MWHNKQQVEGSNPSWETKKGKNMSLISQINKKELTELIIHSTSYREVLIKMGYNCVSGFLYKELKKRIKELDIIATFDKKEIKRKENSCIIEPLSDKEVFSYNINVGKKTVRNHFKKITKDKYYCWICGQKPEWQGKELPLIMDHIDGDNNNHNLNNLRWVCPNCNYQLPTSNGKNIKTYKNREKKYCTNCGKELNKKNSSTKCSSCFAKELVYKEGNFLIEERISREELKKLIRLKSFTEIGKDFNVTDNAVRKWCKYYNLPFRVKDIKDYSNEEWEKI